jgi:hypothetical protein
MKSVNVDNDVLELHNRALLEKNAVYPLVESSVNFASIPANLKTINVQGISQGTVTFLHAMFTIFKNLVSSFQEFYHPCCL